MIRKKVIFITSGIAIILSIAVIGLCGIAWYIGLKITQSVTQEIHHLNSLFIAKSPHSPIQIVLRNHHRGIFSSYFEYQLHRRYGDSAPFVEEMITEGEITLYHGPYPLNRIRHQEWQPKIFSADYDFSTLPGLTRLITLTGQQYPIIARIDMQYDKKLTAKITLAAINQTQYPIINTAPLVLKLVTTNLEQGFSWRLALPSIQLELTPQHQLAAKRIILKGRYQKENWTFSSEMQYISNKGPLHSLHIDQLQLTTRQQKDNNLIFIHGNNWTVNNQLLGSGELEMNLTHAPQFPWIDFLQSPTSLLLLTDYIGNIYLNGMKEAGTAIDIRRFSWQQSDKTLSLMTSLLLANNDTLPIPDIKQLHLDINADLSLAANLINAYQQLFGSHTNKYWNDMLLHTWINTFNTSISPDVPFVLIDDNAFQHYMTYNINDPSATINGLRLPVTKLATILHAALTYKTSKTSQ